MTFDARCWACRVGPLSGLAAGVSVTVAWMRWTSTTSHHSPTLLLITMCWAATLMWLTKQLWQHSRENAELKSDNAALRQANVSAQDSERCIRQLGQLSQLRDPVLAQQRLRLLLRGEALLLVKDGQRACYNALLRFVLTSYEDAAAMQRKGGLLTALSRWAPQLLRDWEFNDKGQWHPVTTAREVMVELDKLEQSTTDMRVYYTMSGTSYTAFFRASDQTYWQTNTKTNYTRQLRTGAQSAADRRDQKLRSRLLFGDPVVQLSSSLLRSLLDQATYPFDDAQFGAEPSLIVAELAQFIVDQSHLIGQNRYLYVPRNAGNTCRCELWIKPVHLRGFLRMAQSRGLTHVKVGVHAGPQATYDGARADPVGFNMKWAGARGARRGHGVYFALSDHLVPMYNTSGVPGTFILSLLLMEPSESKNTGSYDLYRHTVTPVSAFRRKISCLPLFDPPPPASSPLLEDCRNAVCYRERELTLIVGLAAPSY